MNAMLEKDLTALYHGIDELVKLFQELDKIDPVLVNQEVVEWFLARIDRLDNCLRLIGRANDMPLPLVHDELKRRGFDMLKWRIKFSDVISKCNNNHPVWTGKPLDE